MAGDQRATVAELLQRLEEGVRGLTDSDSWRSYLRAQARFHQYSLGNVLLMLAQRPQGLTRVAGYETWRSLGRHVRKGEKGIRILAPVTVRRRDDDEDETQPLAIATRFRVVYVWDQAQTDGEALVENPCRELRMTTEAGRDLYARLLDIARAEGIPVRDDRTELGSAKGVYVPGMHAIGIAAGLAGDQRAKTLAHELGHALLHRAGDRPRDEEEAEAEGVAYVVSTWAGIDVDDYSFGYVATWAGRKDGPALVRRVGATIQKTAAAIIDRLVPAEARRTA